MAGENEVQAEIEAQQEVRAEIVSEQAQEQIAEAEEPKPKTTEERLGAVEELLKKHGIWHKQ